MSEWKTTLLESVASFKNGESSPERINDGHFPVYGSNGIIGFTNSYNSEEGTIIIGRVGSYCGSIYYSDMKCWVTDNAIIGKGKETADTKFLYYFLLNRKLNKLKGGSGQPLLNQSILNQLEVYISIDPKEQQGIAEVLSVIDSNIALLRRQNETLENIAQTLFNHWFVDFEFPDGNGRPYKSSGGKMMLSEEFGDIPDGWSVGKLGDLCSILNEGMNPTERKGEMFYLYSIDAFDTGMLPKEEVGESMLSNKFLVKSNTILVSKLNPRTPRIWPVLKIDEKRAICSTEFQVLIPHNSYYCYIYNLLKSRNISKQIAQMASGTSGSHQRIRPDDILNISIIKPKESLVISFEDKMSSIVEKTITNIKLTQTLAKTRDSLLPKLMSGRIRVTAQWKN